MHTSAFILAVLAFCIAPLPCISTISEANSLEVSDFKWDAWRTLGHQYILRSRNLVRISRKACISMHPPLVLVGNREKQRETTRSKRVEEKLRKQILF